MNFKPGQLVRRIKLSKHSFVTPIVPLGMVVQVLYIEGSSMTVTFSNAVFGIGSYAYNYHTRDTLGMAIKCTAAWDIKGTLIETQKTVKTDSTKKSAKGLLHVDSNFVMTDSVTPEQEATGELKVLYHNGTLLLEDNFETIRTRAQQ